MPSKPTIQPDFTKLPAKAAHLKTWILPDWLSAATHELGVSEITGAKSNPRIMDYRAISGLKLVGEDSVVPWCAIFINAMLAKAGVQGSGSAMARSFVSSKNFEKLDKPMVGCITVISSSRGPASGHVFFCTAENGLFFQALGGNQDDSVNIAMFQKKKLVGHFWPKGQPKLPAPYDKPVKLARPLLPHERVAQATETRDA
jgi:uncharacterized protein (TIGR02594 family)